MAEHLQVHTAPNGSRIPSLGLPHTFPTIAYFSSSPGGIFSYEKWQMWRGIAEAAREWGLNLIYLAGEEFETSPQAVLYDLVSARNVDGIIFWNSFFSLRSTVDLTQAYIDHYRPLPVVSIELALEGTANLMLDNIQGVRDLLVHLIEVHGYQKVAFIHEDDNCVSRSRMRAYQQIISEYDRFDPALIGTLAEFDARGLRPGVDYQAIIAYSDFAAVEATEALQARGFRVPDEVAVTGFNDGMEARGAMPPLTTVRLPFRRLGRQAVEILAHAMQGEPADLSMNVPLQLILRRSCGCLEPLAEQAAAGPSPAVTLPLYELLDTQREQILIEMARGMGTPIENFSRSWAERLFDLFVICLQDLMAYETDQVYHRYMSALNQILRNAVEEGANVSRWHEALSILRRYVRPSLNGQSLALAEDLWQQARVLIGQAAVRAETHRSWKTAQRAEILRSIEAQLLTSLDLHDLLNVLRQGLPNLGIGEFYLVLYEDQFRPDGWARLVLARQSGCCADLQPENQRFHPYDLLPPGWILPDQPFALLFEALHLREEQLGYVVFQGEAPPDGSSCEVFQALRLQLSSALREVRLRQKLNDALRQAEEANLLKSRFLSMVSHELRTPINLIVGLSEMAMRQQVHGRKQSLEVLNKFNEQIYVSGQHLDRLIRDVLDLASSQAGQMNLICQPLDLTPMLKDVTSIGSQLAEQKNLLFQADIPKHLPKVMGDKTRLRQILLNLLSNAVKFTAHGRVVLKVRTSPKEITFIVEDTGLGIAREEQERIFDEFHQSDRTAVRGYGGIGLGLAITRRLVELHGGRIWVTSSGSEDSGSKFHFTIPVLPQEMIPEEKRINTSSDQVLVLTPQAGGAKKLIQRLSHHGFSVKELAIENHPGFIGDLIADPPGAVVLNLTPDSEQGWEIIKQLKEIPGTQDMPVLFYSLMAEQDSGAVFEMDILSKPVGAEQLIRALRRHGIKTGGHDGERKILIIDDEPGILDLHARMLRSELDNCQLFTASSGKEGLALMRTQLPDLVLLDLMMPELDGFGVLKIMQEEQLLRNIPVIILSAQVLTHQEMVRLSQGVAAVLGKGLFSAKETIARIESALARNKRLGSETQRLVHHGMAFIHEHYRELITRADIANHLSVNEQYLSRAFNKEMGIGPMAYLSRYRIQQAKHLLEMGTLSITQVALEVGLSSQSYFSRIFQHETGLTPSAYQRGERNKESSGRAKEHSEQKER